MPSRRELIRMTAEEVDEFLHGRHTMNIATIGPDGNVHLVAMWYGFLGSNPAFETFTKSQKVLNLRRDPRITALVESGETYDQLKGVEIVGRAIIHEGTDELEQVARDVGRRYWGVGDGDDDALDAIVATLIRKRVCIEIVPERIVSWDHAKLGGGY